MAALSDMAAKSNYVVNKFRHNGKEERSKEFSDGSGLEEYDCGARFFDNQIGRWTTIDPLASTYSNMSPYVAMDNNLKRQCRHSY